MAGSIRKHWRKEAGRQYVGDSVHKYKLMEWTHDKPNIEIQLTEGLIKQLKYAVRTPTPDVTPTPGAPIPQIPFRSSKTVIIIILCRRKRRPPLLLLFRMAVPVCKSKDHISKSNRWESGVGRWYDINSSGRIDSQMDAVDAAAANP